MDVIAIAASAHNVIGVMPNQNYCKLPQIRISLSMSSMITLTWWPWKINWIPLLIYLV